MHQARPAATVRLVVVLGCLSALAPLAVDMYLPGWPAIQDSLDASASAVQLTLTAFLLGLAVGQLLSGPLSDRVGRRGPLLWGVAAFVVTTVACALAPSIGVLVGLRFLQGVAGGAGIAIGRAIVRDLGGGDDAARNFAMLILITNVGPIVAPVLGAQLLYVTDWRGIFMVLAAVILGLLAVSWRTVPETLGLGDRTTGGLRAMGAALHEVGRDRVFLGYAVSSGLVFSAMMAYIAGSPFVLQDIYGLSPQLFSVVFAINGLGIVVVTHVSRRLIGRFTPRALLLVGMGMTSAGAGILAAAVAAGDARVAVVLVAFFLIVSSIGLVQPNATTLAMAEHPRVAGSASALLGVLQGTVSALVAPLVGIGGSDTAVPLAVIIGALVVLGWVTLLPTRARRPAPAEAPSAV